MSDFGVSTVAEDAPPPPIRSGHRPVHLDGRTLVRVVVAGIAVDAAVRTPGSGAIEVVAVGVLGLGLLLGGHLARRQARAAAAVAVLFAALSMIRASPWLVPLDLLAAAMLLLVAAALARQGDLADLSWPGFALRVVWATGYVLRGPAYLAAALGTRRRATPVRRVARQLTRGLLLAAPLATVLTVLLASADAVFAHLLRVPVDPGDLVVHVVLITVGACVMVGLLGGASNPAPVDALPAHRRLLGATEALVVEGVLVAVFSLFAVAQVVALSSGGRRLLETNGLTYAEYARSGYFQLLAVAAITLTALLGVRALADLTTPAASRWFAAVGQAAVALTLVVLVVALRRLDLYEDTFGLTMLRLYSEVFAWWLAVALVLLALALTPQGARRAWLPLGSVATGLFALLALNVINPEATVVRHNLDHFAETGRFDAEYFGELSADAAPEIVEGLERLDPELHAALLAVICPRRPDDERGLAAFNLSRAHARDRLDTVCPPNLRQ